MEKMETPLVGNGFWGKKQLIFWVNDHLSEQGKFRNQYVVTEKMKGWSEQRETDWCQHSVYLQLYVLLLQTVMGWSFVAILQFNYSGM